MEHPVIGLISGCPVVTGPIKSKPGKNRRSRDDTHQFNRWCCTLNWMTDNSFSQRPGHDYPAQHAAVLDEP